MAAGHRALFYSIKDMIEDFLTHVEDGVMGRQGLLRHPLREAVVFLREPGPAVELALHRDRLFPHRL
jgi:hypothetical protein